MTKVIKDRTIQERKCTVCGDFKEVKNFHKNRTKRGGIEAQCNSCRSRTRIEKRQNNTKIKTQKTMVRTIDGDLIKMAQNGDFEVIAQGCNCFNNFGAGLALQIKNTFPEAYEVDYETIAGDKNKMGTISYTENTFPTVVNIYQQYGFAQKHGDCVIDYDALRSGLKAMVAKFSGKTFGLPMLGSLRAGGDWNIIKEIIEEEMRGQICTVVNYVP